MDQTITLFSISLPVHDYGRQIRQSCSRCVRNCLILIEGLKLKFKIHQTAFLWIVRQRSYDFEHVNDVMYRCCMLVQCGITFRTCRINENPKRKFLQCGNYTKLKGVFGLRV
jgi:hypothetical protein